MTKDFELLIAAKLENFEKQLSYQQTSNEQRLKRFEEFLDKMEKKVEEIGRGISDLKLSHAQHYFSCPNTKEIKLLEEALTEYKDEINEQLTETNFFRKHPNIFIGTIVVGILAMLFVYANIVNKWDDIRYTFQNTQQVIDSRKKDLEEK